MNILDISQDVLTQPTRGDEDTPTWRARYTEAHAALIAALYSLPDNLVYHVSEAERPSWLSNPNVVVLLSERSTVMTVPAFQIGDNGEPLDVVLQVNLRLGMLYHQVQGPWVSPHLATLVWWLLVHPKLGVAPITLIGTDGQAELVELATDPLVIR